jgi:hypothetical protein
MFVGLGDGVFECYEFKYARLSQLKLMDIHKRPPGVPCWGFARGGKLVTLPRPRHEALADPLSIVAGLHWPCWYPALPEDRLLVRGKKSKKRKRGDRDRDGGLDPDQLRFFGLKPEEGGADAGVEEDL